MLILWGWRLLKPEWPERLDSKLKARQGVQEQPGHCLQCPITLLFLVSSGILVSQRLTVVIRRPEGLICHPPPRWEDDKVSNGHSRSERLGREHCENGRILWTQKGRLKVRRLGGDWTTTACHLHRKVFSSDTFWLSDPGQTQIVGLWLKWSNHSCGCLLAAMEAKCIHAG